MTRPPRHRTLLLILVVAGAGHARCVSGAEQTLDGRTFTLADGFTLERIAGPPLVDRPITADFDERGRLYVTDSSGSNDKVDVQLAEKPHRVLRLEDTDGDGRFDRRTVFAEHMMFPEGTLWHNGSLYVSAPPSIWKLTDTNDDGVADERVEWFEGKTLTGCANDLHGPYLGPDGWIYWAKGAFARQTYDRPDKPPFVTRAAHVFRCRPDGTGIEPVMTGGMDNPVDVVFTPSGERILSNTFIQHPANGRRDGLLHIVYGGVYGKVHDVLDGHTRTGPDVMPVLAHLGPAAPCGLTTYTSGVFGDSYRDNLFTCNFNLQRITRHILSPSGATFASRDEDFLVTQDRDFHPTDVLEDADGSLVVVDTGGWYKLCCPTSQLPKPDVLGVIYRVRKTGAPRVDDPRGQALAWSNVNAIDLVSRLDDDRPATRRRAIAALAALGRDALPALTRAIEPGLVSGGREFSRSGTRGADARVDVVWAASRIDHQSARALIRKALGDPNETVCHAACLASGLWRDREALSLLVDQLKSRSAQLRRASAEALGRIGDPAAIPPLLVAAGEPCDRFLEHSLTYALIEIGQSEATSAGLKSTNAGTRRAAIVALDQMGAGTLTPDLVASDLAANDRATREIASWIVGRHPEWAAALVGFFKERIESRTLTETERSELVEQLARFASTGPLRALLTESLAIPGVDARETRRLALKAMARSGLKTVPKEWVDGISSVLASDPVLTPEVVATTRALPISRDMGKTLTAGLLEIADAPETPPPARLQALSAVPGGLERPSAGKIAFLLAQIVPENPVSERTAAAQILARAKLSGDQLDNLTETVRTAGPLEVDKLLAAFEGSKDDAVGAKLLAALKASPSLMSLRVDMLKPRLDKFGPDVRARAEELYASLNVDAATQKARLEEMLPTLTDGDIRRGQAVFNGAKAACLSCHSVGYLGGKVGPDLTRIGQIRNERDLLESILFPSLSFVRSYEPVSVATRDGKIASGILRKDSADEVVLAVNATEEAHIARGDIEEMRPGSVSVMPSGLDQQLSRQDLADLIAFLKSRK